MFKKLYLCMAIILVGAVFLTACERSASSPLLPTPTATSRYPFPTPEDLWETLGQVETMTAMASDMQTTGPTATPDETPIPATVTETPPAYTPTLTPTQVITIITPTPGRPATYTLMPGEFPYCIARRFNVNADELLALNGLTDGMLFLPGLMLKIPQTGNPFPAERALHPHPATYTVIADDSIYSIACYYGDVYPLAIAAANNLVSPYTLRIGQILNIP